MRAAFSAHGDEIACVIVEPVAGNMGVVPPAADVSRDAARALHARAARVLIFDEVITGFRVAWGGAQERFGVEPDMITLGKIIGGGLPVGAFGGRAEIMDTVAPLGSTYQAGTLAGNPLAMAAGIGTLTALGELGVYERLEARAAQVEAGLREAAGAAGVPVTVNRVGAMLTMFFSEGPVDSFAAAMRADTDRYGRYFRAMLEGGVYLAPSQFESVMVSLALTDADLEQAQAAAAAAFAAL